MNFEARGSSAGWLAGAAALAMLASPGPVPAQEAEAVGPPQLRDFRLDAPRRPVQPSMTQDAPPAPAPQSVPVQPQPQPQGQHRQPEPATTPPAARSAPQRAPTQAAPSPPAVAPRSSLPAEAPVERSTPPPALEPVPAPQAVPQAAAPLQALGPVQAPAPPPAVEGNGTGWLLWLAGAALLALLAFLGLRARRRVPAPAPLARARPAPAPSRVQPAPATVSVPEPRASLELDFSPQRAAATDSATEVQFELVVRNTGKTEARAVRIEARMFNAAAEAEIDAFFSSGQQQGEAGGLAIPAGMEARARSQVMMPLESVRPILVQDRRLFVPLVAFNVFYEWGDGRRGQTSRSWIVGREAQPPAEKMGAFRLDLGPRIYRQVGRRQHQLARVL